MNIFKGMVAAFVGMMLTVGPTWANDCCRESTSCCVKKECPTKSCEKKKCCFDFSFFNCCKPKCHEKRECCEPKKCCREHRCHEHKPCCEKKCCVADPYVVTCRPDEGCDPCNRSHYYHPDLFGGYETDSCCELHYQFYSNDLDALDNECKCEHKHHHYIDPCHEHYYWKE